jgi:signal peptidase II
MRSTGFARAGIAVAASVLVADQITKALVAHEIPEGSRRVVIAGVVELVHARNSGIAGGHLAGTGALVLVVSSLALAGLVALALSTNLGRARWLALGLILGGGLGNLLDRVRTGAVTDFLVLGDRGPANVADQAIFVGAVAILVLAVRSERPRTAVPTA